LVLLDVMLPGTTGMDLCRALRAKSSIPIIMVTARGSETDRVLGLELGADDYLPKPFGGPELIARIRAILRRSQMVADEPAVPRGRRLHFAEWTLDLARRELMAPDGAAVDLSGAEYDTLLAFLEHPHRVLSRDQLLEFSRNRLGEVLDRSVDVLVSRLRRKIEPEPADQAMIKTVRGTGYMFVPDVTRS
jgi:two-component system, OmpR family, response regulator